MYTDVTASPFKFALPDWVSYMIGMLRHLM